MIIKFVDILKNGKIVVQSGLEWSAPLFPVCEGGKNE